MTIDPKTFAQLIEDSIPFNKHLGVKLESFDFESARVVTRVEMRDEFIGNSVRGMPHGGLISALIDATAGAAAAVAVREVALIPKIATIDMRVDYLKPAQGEVLFTTAEVMRSGKRVIVVRCDVHDDRGVMVALGTNVFNISR